LRQHHRRQKREIAALLARTAQLSTEQTDLRKRAMLDELTGLLNRRGLDEAIDGLRGRKGPHALIVLALDHFKRINDTLGHEAGDRVLRRVAAVMAQNIRHHDMLARWGGEEFVVICLDCSVADASSVAEKIRLRIAAGDMDEGSHIPLTASLGVAAMPEADSFSRSFRLADTAMYRAKSSGRNRVELADDGPPAPQASQPPAGSAGRG
jgi:diguanylate cyclase (GGDEF)-like protein